MLVVSSEQDGLTVEDLLTTRQLQDLLRVDRITIYRMLRDGRLRGFKVGGQWRFSRREIEAWLQNQWKGADEPFRRPSPERAGDASSSLLPLSCVQVIQDLCAEALTMALVTVDPTGMPLTRISNSCEFCSLILASPEGRRRCHLDWAQSSPDEARACHVGLLCLGTPIEIEGRRAAIVVGCQFTVRSQEGDSFWRPNVPMLASELGVDEQDLLRAMLQVRRVSGDASFRMAQFLQRMAHTFAEIGQERLSLLNRLHRIAEISQF